MMVKIVKNMISAAQELNAETGEITKATVFHTRFNTVADSGEHYEPNTSLTDATQYEPIQSLINRIVRPREDLVWSDIEDVTSEPGFDLADVGDVVADTSAIIAEQKATEASQAPVAPSNDSAPQNVSEIDAKTQE